MERIPEENINEAKKLLRHGNYRQRQISEMTGVNQSIVSDLAKKVREEKEENILYNRLLSSKFLGCSV